MSRRSPPTVPLTYLVSLLHGCLQLGHICLQLLLGALELGPRLALLLQALLEPLHHLHVVLPRHLELFLLVLQPFLYVGPHLRPVTSTVHRKKKVREFPVPSRDVTTKLSLGGNNDVITELFLPRGSLVSAIPAGDGKLVNLFLRCNI
jgi:hypothetical protein